MAGRPCKRRNVSKGTRVPPSSFNQAGLLTMRDQVPFKYRSGRDRENNSNPVPVKI